MPEDTPSHGDEGSANPPVETVVGVLPPGRYQLRQRSDGKVEVVRLVDRRRRPNQGVAFWSSLEQFDRGDGDGQ